MLCDVVSVKPIKRTAVRSSEALLDRLEDAELTKIVKERRGGKTVKVKLEDL